MDKQKILKWCIVGVSVTLLSLVLLYTSSSRTSFGDLLKGEITAGSGTGGEGTTDTAPPTVSITHTVNTTASNFEFTVSASDSSALNSIFYYSCSTTPPIWGSGLSGSLGQPVTCADPSGTTTFYAKVRDIHGNEGTGTDVYDTIQGSGGGNVADTTKPTITDITITKGDTSATISTTVNDNATSISNLSVEYKCPGMSTFVSIVPNPSGAVSVQCTGEGRDITATVKATDSAGNIETKTQTYTFDTTAPIVSVTTNPVNLAAHYNSDITFNVSLTDTNSTPTGWGYSCVDSTGSSYKSNGWTSASHSNGSWVGSFTCGPNPGKSGAYSATIWGYNNEERQGSQMQAPYKQNVTWNVDVSPSIISTPIITKETAAVNISATVSDNNTLTATNFHIKCGNSAAPTNTPTYDQSSKKLSFNCSGEGNEITGEIKVIDIAGNTSITPYTYTFDTTPPKVTVTTNPAIVSTQFYSSAITFTVSLEDTYSVPKGWGYICRDEQYISYNSQGFTAITYNNNGVWTGSFTCGPNPGSSGTYSATIWGYNSGGKDGSTNPEGDYKKILNWKVDLKKPIFDLKLNPTNLKEIVVDNLSDSGSGLKEYQTKCVPNGTSDNEISYSLPTTITSLVTTFKFLCDGNITGIAYVRVFNNAGNYETKNIEYNLQTPPAPAVSVTGIYPNSTLPIQGITINGITPGTGNSIVKMTRYTKNTNSNDCSTTNPTNLSVTTTSHIDGTVNRGEQYCYSYTIQYAGGGQVESAKSVVVPEFIAIAPGISNTANKKEVKITVQKVGDATSFRIRRFDKSVCASGNFDVGAALPSGWIGGDISFPTGSNSAEYIDKPDASGNLVDADTDTSRQYKEDDQFCYAIRLGKAGMPASFASVKSAIISVNPPVITNQPTNISITPYPNNLWEIKWVKPLETPILGYQIYRFEFPKCETNSFTLNDGIKEVYDPNSTETSIRVSLPNEYFQYCYRIRAINGSSEGPFSPPTKLISNNTDEPKQLTPTKPTFDTTQNPGKLKLNWTAIPHAEGYEISASILANNTCAISETSLKKIFGNVLTGEIDIPTGNKYCFALRGLRASGASFTKWSSIYTTGTTVDTDIVKTATPGKPELITIGNATTTTLPLNWGNITGMTYNIDYKECTTIPTSTDTGTPILNLTTNTYTFPTNITIDTTKKYCFRLQYKNSDGVIGIYSDWTAPAAFGAQTLPPKPSGVVTVSATTDTNGQIAISWTKNTDDFTKFTHYRVLIAEYSGTSCGTFTTLEDISIPTTNPSSNFSLTKSGLTASKKYCFQIKTLKDQSTSAEAIFPAAAIYPDGTAPTLTLTNAGDADFKMSFTATDTSGSGVEKVEMTTLGSTSPWIALTAPSTGDIWTTSKLDEDKIMTCGDLKKEIQVTDKAGKITKKTFIFGDLNKLNTIDTGDLASATHFYYFNLIHACSGTTPTAANTPNPLTQTLLAFAHFLNISTIDLFS